MQYVMRDGTNISIKADADLLHQIDTIEKELKRQAGARVGQLLQSVYFPLLQKATQLAKKRSPLKKIEKLIF